MRAGPSTGPLQTNGRTSNRRTASCGFQPAEVRGQGGGPEQALQLDLDIHAGGELEAHERVHRLRGRVEDVDQALVRPDLELLPRVLVDVQGADQGSNLLADYS